MKFDRTRVPEKNALSTRALSKPDMGPQSSPSRPRSDGYEVSALCNVPFRIAVTSATPGAAKYFCMTSASVRQKLWQLAGEIQIVADNDCDRSLQNLRLIPGSAPSPAKRCLFHRG